MFKKYSGFIQGVALLVTLAVGASGFVQAEDTTNQQSSMAAALHEAPSAVQDGVVCLLPEKFHRNLDSTFWRLEKLNDEVPPENLDITMTFHNGTIAGYSGCNSYAGTFVNPTDTLFGIKDLETTKRKCEQAVCPTFIDGGNWEEKYLALLPKAVKVERSDTELKLFDQEGKLMLTFHALKR